MTLAPLVRKVRLVLTAQLVRLAPLVPKVRLVLTAQLVRLALKVLLAPLVRKVRWVRKVRRAQKAPKPCSWPRRVPMGSLSSGLRRMVTSSAAQ